MSISASARRGKTLRTTVALPETLLEKIDREVAEERSASRSEFIWEAAQRELKRRGAEAMDAAFVAALSDADYRRESRELTEAFASADAEAARDLDDKLGVYPMDQGEQPAR